MHKQAGLSTPRGPCCIMKDAVACYHHRFPLPGFGQFIHSTSPLKWTSHTQVYFFRSLPNVVGFEGSVE